jgi:transcriptional regulator with XRE-family HTH domain
MLGSLSLALKQRRLQLGLTLSQVARRVRTSPAAISRYESGWHRFELYTLQKLASALGCRLRIGLDPVNPRMPAASTRSSLKRLGRLFWDTPLRQEDLHLHPRWVVRRVLETGALEDVRMLVGLLGKDRVLSEAASIPFRSMKTAGFWKSMRELEG